MPMQKKGVCIPVEGHWGWLLHGVATAPAAWLGLCRPWYLVDTI